MHTWHSIFFFFAACALAFPFLERIDEGNKDCVYSVKRVSMNTAFQGSLCPLKNILEAFSSLEISGSFHAHELACTLVVANLPGF